MDKNRNNKIKTSTETVASCTNHNINSPQEEQYKCECCSFSSEWAGDYFKHMTVAHGLSVPNGYIF